MPAVPAFVKHRSQTTLRQVEDITNAPHTMCRTAGVVREHKWQKRLGTGFEKVAFLRLRGGGTVRAGVSEAGVEAGALAPAATGDRVGGCVSLST